MATIVLHNDNINQRFKVLTKLIEVLKIDDISANNFVDDVEKNGKTTILNTNIEEAINIVTILRYGRTKLNVEINL